jgi:hypothetical protein
MERKNRKEETMNKFALIGLLLLSVVAWAGAEPDAADYPLNVHVSSCRFKQLNPHILRLSVAIDGKKYELEAFSYHLLAPGDYKAKLVPAKRKITDPYEVDQTYELLFPDKKTKRYVLVGLWE